MMANRLALPRLPRPSIGIALERVRAAPRRLAGLRPPRGHALRVRLFQIAFAPLWFSSEIPAPSLAPRDRGLLPGGPAGDHVARLLDQLVRRIWFQRTLTVLCRAAWLPLLVGIGWLAIELRDGPDFNARALIWIEAAFIGPALAFAFAIKPTRREVARALDRSFDLQDRMVTAFENIGRNVPDPGGPVPVPYLQIADAANVITELRRHQVFRIHFPIRELVLGIACAQLLAALFFMRGAGGDIPAIAGNPVPVYVSAAERLANQRRPESPANAVTTDAPTRAVVQARAERSNQAQQDLKRLAGALADQAVTRAAAEAILQGDYARAADLIRQVAENADQLSEAARQGLANDLDQAAAEMSAGSEDLADSSRDAAAGLREGGEAAKDGMRQLGDEVDRTAADIVSQQDLANDMQRAEEAETGRSPSGEAGASGNSSSGEPSDSGTGEADQSDSGSNASGSGADARPGDGAGGEQGSPESSDGSSGDSETSGETDSGGSDAGPSRPGGAGAQSDSSATDPGGSDHPGDGNGGLDGGESSASGMEGEGGAPGGGAGSGDPTGVENPNEGSPGADAGATEGESTSDPSVTVSETPDGKGAGATTDPRDAITLSRSPGGETIQTSGSSGAATSGSGGGAAAGEGTSTQGDTGEAGPDSNRVPAEYRGIVEEYFSDPEQ